MIKFPDGDAIFCSSDGVRFSVHRKRLEFYADAPSAESVTDGEIVYLTEDATTLDLLFRCIYPGRMPDIRALPFSELASLAEAAEKYEVHLVKYTCSMQMRCAPLVRIDDS